MSGPTVAYRSERTIGSLGIGVPPSRWRLPVDVGIGSGDRLFVIDRGFSKDNAGESRGWIWDVNDEQLGRFGFSGWGDGQLMRPTAVAVDARDRVYVSDEARHDVQVFDRNGDLLGKWGTHGNGPGEFDRPAGLAIDPDGNVLVADSLNHRIQKLTPDGRPLAQWGRHGSAPGALDQPWGLAVDARGDVYVADWGNDRIQKFSSEGRYLMTFGSSGSAEGQLRQPSGVAVDDEGDVYVADLGNDRVQVFSREGAHRATLLGDAGLSKQSFRWGQDLANHFAGYLAYRALFAAEQRVFNRPTAVKIDRQGRLLVVDTSANRIQVYEKIPVTTAAAGSPLMTSFVRAWSELLEGADRLRLDSYIPLIEAAPADPKDEARRTWLAVDWLVRDFAPAWLDLAGLTEHAKHLRELPELQAREEAESAIAVLDAAQTATERAMVDAVPEATRSAAWDAAQAAAWPAVRHAAWVPAAAAAREIAQAAAWVAASGPLPVRPSGMQGSLFSLFDRMLARTGDLGRNEPVSTTV